MFIISVNIDIYSHEADIQLNCVKYHINNTSKYLLFKGKGID